MGSGQRKRGAELDYLLLEVSIAKESNRNREDVYCPQNVVSW